MEQNSQDQSIDDLVEGINNIYIDENELLSISLEFSDVYFKRSEKEEEDFDKFWESPVLHEMLKAATQEAISLAVATLTLKEDVDFENLIMRVIDKEKQVNSIKQLSSNLLEKRVLKSFVYTLRREIYSRAYSQSKSFIAASGLTKEIIEKRKDLFMEINDGEI